MHRSIIFLAVSITYSYLFYQFFLIQHQKKSDLILNRNIDGVKDATSGTSFKVIKSREVPQFSYNFKKYVIEKYTRCTSEKWAVTTSINYPTEAILQLASSKDVCLVVVGDKKSPANFTINSNQAIFLSLSLQKKLPYKIIDILPVNNFARKIIGYLFAIQHGAKQIYDFDDDNILIHNNSAEIFDQKPMLSISSEQLSFNAYRFYQEDNHTYIWPRGYPFEDIKEEPAFQTDQLTNPSKVQVIQFLQNENPDLDAVYRLTQTIPKTFRKDLNKCIAINNFCPFNSQSTLFLYDSFPLLLLPMTVNGRVSDIWRSFILETVFRANGKLVSFCPSLVTHLRNPHSLLKDFNAEIPLYTQSKQLLLFLKNMTVDKSTEIAIKQIYNALYENDIIQFDDLELVSRWLFDLNMIGFRFN